MEILAIFGSLQNPDWAAFLVNFQNSSFIFAQILCRFFMSQKVVILPTVRLTLHKIVVYVPDLMAFQEFLASLKIRQTTSALTAP